MSLLRLLSGRYLQQRWDRGVLVVISIALGVATLISARILNQCIAAAAMETTAPLPAAQLYITNGEAGVMRELVGEIRAARIPGVRAVEPLVFERITVPDLQDRPAVLLGAEVSTQMLSRDNPLKVRLTLLPELPKWQLLPILQAVQEGNWTQVTELWERLPGRLAVVSRPLYEAWQQSGSPPRPFRIRHAARDVECLLVGVVDFDTDSPLAGLGQYFVGMSVGQAARVIRPLPPLGGVAGAAAATLLESQWPEKVNRIDIFLEPDADREAVELALNAIVGVRAAVRTPDAARQSTQEVVAGLQIAFYVCALGAMIVGLFLVYNAMVVTVAERQVDIAILRALGASRGQIIGLFALMAATLGLAGAAAGIPLGLALAETAFTQFREELESMFLSPEVSHSRRLSWDTAAWAVAAGVTVAVAAALIPALQAANDDPAQAARRGRLRRGRIWKWLHYASCLLLVGGGGAAIAVRQELPHRAGSIGGMAAVLVGLLLSTPLWVRLLVPLLQPVVRQLFPFTVRLAFDNLARTPARTGVVIGAMAAGVALMIQTAGVGRSNEEPIVAWIEQVVQADFFLFSGNMASANTSNSPMPGTVAAEVARLPGVDGVMAIRYSRLEFNDTMVYLLAVDAEAYARATRARVPVGMPDLEKFLELPDTDNALVSENFARRHRVRPGDLLTLPGPRGPLTFRVLGTVRDYSWSRGTVFIDRRRYAALYNDPLIDMCHVFLSPQPERFRQGEQRLRHYAAAHGLFVTDRRSLRDFLTELINRIYLFAYVQQVVVGIVAALGVVTALLISVLQRQRELGLLRAVGATRTQILASLVAEALLMGLFGTALGIAVGLLLEWYILDVIMLEESGFVFEMLIPWKQVGSIAAAALVTAGIAALLPALKALRLNIPEVLQYE